MLNTKLILIEGPHGSGKTTTGKWLETLLIQKGINAKFFEEFDGSHPIPGATDQNQTPFEIKNTVDPLVKFAYWQALAKEGTDTVFIFDGRLWQNTLMYSALNNTDEAKLLAAHEKILSLIQKLNPTLIFLNPSSPKDLFKNLFEERGEDYQEWMTDLLLKQEWTKEHVENSDKALETFASHWFSFMNNLYKKYPYQKLKIDNPQKDWNECQNAIEEFLLK